MGSFLTGLLQGNVDTSTKMKKGDKKGLLRKKKKSSGTTEMSAGDMPEFKRGGRVRRTGTARVHKGERVLTAKQAKRYRSKKR